MTFCKTFVRIGLCLAVHVALWAGDALPAQAQGLNRFHQGNSLTGPLVNDSGGSGGVIHALAVDAGFPKDSQQMVKNAGIPIDAIFNKRHNPTMEDDIKRILRVDAPFPVVCVQPYGHQNTRRPETEAAAAAFIYEQALKHTQQASLFVYYNWVSYDASEGAQATVNWRERTLASHTNHFDPIVDYLRDEFPGRRVHVLPVGQALVALSDLIEGGKVSGLKSTRELFDIPTKEGGQRTVHPHARGYYLAGLVHLFSYYHGQMKAKPGDPGYTKDRGSLEGEACWCKQGVYGGAIQFPGEEGSYIRLERSGDIQALSGPDPRSHKHSTFAFWFKASDMNRPKVVQTLFESGGYHNNINIFIYEGVLHIGLCSGYPSAPTPDKPPSLQKPQWMNTRDNLGKDVKFELTDGTWHHIALSIEGNDTPNKDGFKVYLDGQFAMSAPGVQIHQHVAAAGFGAVNDEAIYPSARHGWTPIPTNPRAPDADPKNRPESETRGIHPFAGMLDDFRLYQRVLTVGEIKQLHDEGREALAAAAKSNNRE